MRNALVKAAIALVLSLFLTWIYLFTPQSFFSLDNKLRDLMFNIRGELPKSDNVVIIDIDNKSLKEVGQWPWSRDVIAKLLTNLSESKAGIIGLDMVFAEEDRSSPHRLKKKYPNISQSLPNYDKILANTFASAPVVGGYIFTGEETKETNTPLIPAVFIEKGLHKSTYLKETKGIILNTPILQEALYSSGFFVTKKNEGGVVRSAPLIYKYQDVIYPSLALEMLRIYSANNKVEVIGDENGVELIKFGDFSIPTESSGEFIINFRGPKKHFKYLSASDIVSNNFKQSDVENKFILLGTSAPGLKDLRYIAYDSTFPGVEVHANIIDNILEGDFIQRPFVANLYDIIIIWVLVFGLMLLFSLMTSWLVLPVAIILFSLMLVALYFTLFSQGLILTLLTPILAFWSTLILTIAIEYFKTSKQKDQAKRILGNKVSTSVMQHLLDNANEGLIEPKEVESTIFFSDIKGFTSISEKLGSPQKLIDMLNIYMTPMTDIIIQEQGTIDKFIGDAIMAYWNAPVAVEHHATHAVSAAVQQVEQLKVINEIIYKTYQLRLQIGIGLHTGVVTAGDMGSVGRSDYTIIGDNVNLASRMEGLTRVYDVDILISEATYKDIKESQHAKNFHIRAIDSVEVKGRSQATNIYEVITAVRPVSKEEFTLHAQALQYFKEANVVQAYELFTKLNTHYPCTLYAHFIERCTPYLEDATLTFSPILKMTSK
ncbi:MAG: adenylate/guanylate cyclase domain-containing protein [Sulfurovum sp.]|nr:adenylate/guanylate cyclase domain-containing protein [Sulfurovum sp.]